MRRCHEALSRDDPSDSNSRHPCRQRDLRNPKESPAGAGHAYENSSERSDGYDPNSNF